VKVQLLDAEKEWFVSAPSSLCPAKYASIAVLRRTLDYAAFRTEADRYTNSVATPASFNSDTVIERALILASKQKAVERRHQNQLIRDLKPDASECYLKDDLCLECPVCVLNGGIKAEKGAGEVSIKSRVLYQTAFSILPFEKVVESVTFNAVNERTTKTDQALGERELVKPDTFFMSAITLLAPTLDELKFYLHSMLNTTRYGAETRGMGVIENRLVALILSSSEQFSALGLAMDVYGELVAGNTEMKLTHEAILDAVHGTSMKRMGESGLHRVISRDEIPSLESSLRHAVPDSKWIEGMFSKAQAFKESVTVKVKEEN